MRLLLVLLCMSLGLAFPVYTFAQTNGISITPSLLKLDLSKEEPQAIFYYKNNTKNFIELSFSAQDFTQLEEGWRVKFLDEKSSQNYRYSLTSWIEFEKKSLTLRPYEEGLLKILINKDELSPGGHYAAILAEVAQANEQGQVKIKGILSSLLFVRTSTGKEVELGKISSFESIQSFWDFPNKFLVRFQNTGNVELVPYGVVEIKDPLNNFVAKGILNEGSLITLPGSIKRYDLSVSRKIHTLLPGFYSAQVTLKYGKNEAILKKQNTFFYFGGIHLVLALILIGAVIFILKKGNLVKTN